MINDIAIGILALASVAVNGGVFMRLGSLIEKHDGHERRIEKLERATERECHA